MQECLKQFSVTTITSSTTNSTSLPSFYTLFSFKPSFPPKILTVFTFSSISLIRLNFKKVDLSTLSKQELDPLNS
ncbi:hypothetical protein Hanom_Chr16g01478041 [Helianthus anomalus]